MTEVEKLLHFGEIFPKFPDSFQILPGEEVSIQSAVEIKKRTESPNMGMGTGGKECWCQLRDALPKRIVVQNSHWLVVVPWWATWRFETQLVPLRHVIRMCGT